MTAELGFLEDGGAVTRHFETPTTRGDELHLGVGEMLPKLSRQTGGPRLVVSDVAVLDGDAHDGRESGGCPPTAGAWNRRQQNDGTARLCKPVARQALTPGVVFGPSRPAAAPPPNGVHGG